MKRTSRTLGVFAFILLGLVAAISHAEEKPLSRILFGSCARQDSEQPIWFSIVKTRPDLFLFIGDNIYGDTEDMEVMKAKYAQLAAKPGFKKLRETCPLLATWDDHDYGVNDGGAEYAKKAESQRVFNDFFNVPKDSPRRRRPGVYDAQVFGPQGRRVQVILLDTRYFRSPLRPKTKREKGTGPYDPHERDDVTMLGEAQWKWLEKQLQVPVEVRIVASSVQTIAEESGWECWGNFPRERKRLFDLIGRTKAAGVILISGDRHFAEMSKMESGKSGAGYDVFDVTSSSLNQPSQRDFRRAIDNEPNRHRLDIPYAPVNFGRIEIDWQQDDPPITLAIHDVDGKPVRTHTLRLSQLQP